MCTAISVTSGDNYFGRNLDYEHSFGEKICITPRNYCFNFLNGVSLKNHYAIIGMALPVSNYPLYFDASNEKGLSIAGLNFPGNACYNKNLNNKENIASFEFIPWVLCQCNSVWSAKELISNSNITDTAFNDKLSPTPLHWLVSDKFQSITVEQTKSGMKIYDNPAGVLTNNPTFNIQLFNLNNYMSLSIYPPQNSFSKSLNLGCYSRGMGAIGLPGDFSSSSRFIKAAFVKLNSIFGKTEEQKVNNFFHILYSVYQYNGCVMVENGCEYTQYTSCCNTNKGIYYYTTYNNTNINAVDMHRENLNSYELIIYELNKNCNIKFEN